jgi:hypothetical protein
MWDHPKMSESQEPADEPAHDVLAAEEFAMPAPDPRLHHGPVTLPGDPTGIAEPHDVLAAEEFAMPAPPSGGDGSSAAPRGRPSARTLALAGAGALVLGRLIRRLRRS